MAAGPATSRAESVKLYNGEEFYMQIDSHSIFRRGWDVLAIQLLNACDSPKPFLTSYPMPVRPPSRARLLGWWLTVCVRACCGRPVEIGLIG